MLAGFAFAFYATLLSIDRQKRAVSWTALLSIAASICFLAVTLETTFSSSWRVSHSAVGSDHADSDFATTALSVFGALAIFFALSPFSSR